MSTIEVKVPDIGDFTDIPVIEVLVKAGDRVKLDDSLVTLESDKATMDVPSTVAGIVRSVAVKVGDKVSEGSVVVVIESAAPSPRPSPATGRGSEAPTATASAPSPRSSPAGGSGSPAAANPVGPASAGQGLSAERGVARESRPRAAGPCGSGFSRTGSHPRNRSGIKSVRPGSTA